MATSEENWATFYSNIRSHWPHETHQDKMLQHRLVKEDGKEMAKEIEIGNKCEKSQSFPNKERNWTEEESGERSQSKDGGEKKNREERSRLKTEKNARKGLYGSSVTRKKSPNVYKKLAKNDFTRKMIDFNTLQNLPKNVGDWGKFIVAKGFKKLP